MNEVSRVDLPIACTLTEEQLRERRRELLDHFRTYTHRCKSLPNGYAYTFEACTGLLADLGRLVELERQCCRFLTFRITTEPPQNIRLEITGSSEAKDLITELFRS
jgi:hypothetical protein